MILLLLICTVLLLAFKVIEGDQSTIQRFVYIVGNLACLALAVYKCQVMGLLPTHASDWLAFVEPQQVIYPSIYRVSFQKKQVLNIYFIFGPNFSYNIYQEINYIRFVFSKHNPLIFHLLKVPKSCLSK